MDCFAPQGETSYNSIVFLTVFSIILLTVRYTALRRERTPRGFLSSPCVCMTQTQEEYKGQFNEIQFERDTEICEKQWDEYEEAIYNENCKKIVEDLEPNYKKRVEKYTEDEILKIFNECNEPIMNYYNNQVFELECNGIIVKRIHNKREDYYYVTHTGNPSTRKGVSPLSWLGSVCFSRILLRFFQYENFGI